MSDAHLNPGVENSRELGDGYFVHAVKRWFTWHVSVRYRFGPFSPLVERRKFRHRQEAEDWFIHADKPPKTA
jgi:hypothetical protein